MRSTLALSLAITASSALASPLLDIRDSRGISNTTGLPASFNQTTGASNATALNCTSFVKTFELTSNNTLLAIPIPTGSKAVSDLVTDFVSVNTNFTEEYLVGSNETTGSCKSAQLGERLKSRSHSNFLPQMTSGCSIASPPAVLPRTPRSS
jgi:hypothetical protein